jgi:hypothetical protein
VLVLLVVATEEELVVGTVVAVVRDEIDTETEVLEIVVVVVVSERGSDAGGTTGSSFFNSRPTCQLLMSHSTTAMARKSTKPQGRPTAIPSSFRPEVWHSLSSTLKPVQQLLTAVHVVFLAAHQDVGDPERNAVAVLLTGLKVSHQQSRHQTEKEQPKHMHVRSHTGRGRAAVIMRRKSQSQGGTFWP